MTRGRIIAAMSVAAIVSLILLFGVRVEPTFALSWALVAGIFVLCAQLAIPEDPRVDAPEIPVRKELRGTEVTRMAWSLNRRTGEAGALVTRRVRNILVRRLRRHGLDVDAPEDRTQIEALIGNGLWERLTGSGTQIQDIERALVAIDALSPNREKQ